MAVFTKERGMFELTLLNADVGREQLGFSAHTLECPRA